MILKQADALERRFVAYKNGGDLAIAHGVLLADIDDVAVVDPRVYHAVALAAQREIRRDVLRCVDLAVEILLRKDRLTAGDGAEKRDAPHGRHGDDVVGVGEGSDPPGQLIHIDVKKIGKRFQRFKIRLATTAFIHTNGAFGNAEASGDVALRETVLLPQTAKFI